jgi:small subunit ribosomal protein S20
MANIKQQKKRILVAERQRAENIRYRSSIKTAFRRLQEAVQAGDGTAVDAAHATFVALVDRAAARRALHPNTAARKKSRAVRVIARGPEVVETKKRRTSPKRTTKKAAAAPVDGDAAEPSVENTTEDTPADVADETAVVDESAASSDDDTPAAEAEAPADDQS